MACGKQRPVQGCSGSAKILGTELVKSLLQIQTPAFLSEKEKYLFPPHLRIHTQTFLLRTMSSPKLLRPILNTALSPPFTHNIPVSYKLQGPLPFCGSAVVLYYKKKGRKEREGRGEKGRGENKEGAMD